MLVLTRKSQDSIRIGDNIKVTILRIKGNTVRIGVEAPESVRIVRGELPDFGELSEGANSVDTTPSVGNRETGYPSVDGPAHPVQGPKASRLKAYMPPCTDESQRSHPVNGNRIPPTDNLTPRNTGLPLPPR